MSKEKEHDLELVVARTFGMPWMARKENTKATFSSWWLTCGFDES